MYHTVFTNFIPLVRCFIALRSICLLFLRVCFRFIEMVSMWSPGWPGTHYVDQVSLKLRDLPVSVSRVLGLKVCIATANQESIWKESRNQIQNSRRCRHSFPILPLFLLPPPPPFPSFPHFPTISSLSTPSFPSFSFPWTSKKQQPSIL